MRLNPGNCTITLPMVPLADADFGMSWLQRIWRCLPFSRTCRRWFLGLVDLVALRPAR
jgi:hypothetical protein